MKRIKATFETLKDVCFVIQVAAMIFSMAFSSVGDLLETVAQAV